MTYEPDQLPDDIAQLKAIIVSQAEEFRQADAAKQKTLDLLVAEISRLNVTVEKLTEMYFGKKSEKRPKDKPEEKPSEESEPVDQAVTETSNESKSSETPEIPVLKKPRKKKKKNGGGGRMKIPDDLPIRVVEIHPPLEERTCTVCEKPYKWIGKSVSMRIVYKPASFEGEKTEIHTYAGDCDCSDCRIAKAEPDIQPIDKGIASISLLAIMIIMKFGDHLPLARQALRVFKRSGIVFSQSSMCRWMRQVADVLEPLYDLICDEVLESFCLQIDATFVKCRVEGLEGRCRQTYVYGARGDDSKPYDAFYFSRDGTSKSLMKFVLGFDKTLQCDDNSVTNPIFHPGRVTQEGPEPGTTAPRKQGCWSHGRRYFVKAGKSSASEAVFVVEMIGELYEVESRARKLDAGKRLALRQKESLVILDRIFTWCRENQLKYLPKEAMRTAIDYLLRNEVALRVYCTDGRLEIDNNACERMLRQWAVGRKNWLFFGNERGGKTASILVTILSSARRHGLNEFEYLCDVLARLADLPSESEIRELLPDRWKPKTE